MTPHTIDLSQLKDIHTLPEPPFFPPASGWWLILCDILWIFICCWLWYRLYYQSPQKYALRLLKKIEHSDLSFVAIGVETGKLLKRVALIQFPHEQVADLSGKSWADFLYQHGHHTLSQEQANFIAQSAYLPVEKIIAIDKKKFYTCVRKWIICVFKKRTHGN